MINQTENYLLVNRYHMYIVITKEQADTIRGNYGRYSAIEPVALPDGTFIVPEECMSDPDLTDAKPILETMNSVIKPIDPLPNVGEQVYAGQIYQYPYSEDNKYSPLVIAVQSHIRMNYPPYETPALFTFYRENSDTLEWIPNEKLYLGWKRVYSGITYEVIQEHMSQIDWTPPATLNVLWKTVGGGPGDIPQWVQPTGAQDAYNIGDQVIFENSVWESVINANVWSPTVYPAGWNKL